MKPIGEWTTEEVIEWLEIDAGSHRRQALAELLRRERDRCAEVVLERGVVKFAGVANLYVLGWSQDVADRIRRLT